MTQTVPLRDGAYRLDETGSALLGGTCRSCHKTFFPKPGLCLNCLSDDIQQTELSQQGTLFSWSTIHMPGAHFKPPYTIAYVDLPEGVRLFGPVEGPADGLKAGQVLNVEVTGLWEDDGATVIAHRFRRAG